MESIVGTIALVVVVIVFCSMISKALKNGGCGGFIFALIIVGMIGLAAMNFAK